jgi:hypothetical protein
MTGGLAVLVNGRDVTLVGCLRAGRGSGTAIRGAAAGELRTGLVGLMAGLVMK